MDVYKTVGMTRDKSKWQSVILAPKQTGRYLIADMRGKEFEADYAKRADNSRYWDVPHNVTVMKWKDLTKQTA